MYPRQFCRMLSISKVAGMIARVFLKVYVTEAHWEIIAHSIQVVSTLIQHIHHIPQELLLPLFAKKSAAICPRSHRDESIEYIWKTKKEDIVCSNHVRNQLNQLWMNPSAFLDESSKFCPRHSQVNVLSILYDHIRETESDYVVTCLFSTTAIYLLAKDFDGTMGIHNSGWKSA